MPLWQLRIYPKVPLHPLVSQWVSFYHDVGKARTNIWAFTYWFWSLISVTVNLLVTSQLPRKLSDTLMGLSLMSDISSSPEECSCHERSRSGRLGASIRLPRPVTCWPLKSRTETQSLDCIQLGASTESRDVSDALLMVRSAKHLQVVAFCKTWISGKRRWRKNKTLKRLIVF